MTQKINVKGTGAVFNGEMPGEVAKAPGLEFGLSSPGLFLSLSRTERGALPWL